MKTHLFLLCFIIILSNISFADVSYVCSKEDEIKAEELAATATSWSALYKLYNSYYQCDDGAIAEGFSESVSVIMSRSWSEISSLPPIIKKNAKFEAFILRHLDETVPEERLQLIGNLATNSCPNSAKKLCNKIRIRLKQI